MTVRLATLAIDGEGVFQPALYEWLGRARTEDAVAVLATLRASGETRRLYHAFAEKFSERWTAQRPPGKH